ncbi:MAG: FlgD immunoglobulin-like domain containing protein [Bacteroidota bacterium]|nr:FlgD immunoglobulin-like domain containing protein [Bacteroidota bacterium]
MKTRTVMSLVISVSMASTISAFAQSANDADRISMRLRTVCNYGQGGALIIAFDIKQKAGPNGGVVGGYCVVVTYNSSKLTFQGVTQRYNTNYWPGQPWYISTAYGSSAWFNQHSHSIGATGSSLPLTSTYWSAATDCNGNPLSDGYFEVLRYTFLVGPSAAGTVNFGLYSVLPYRSGIIFQHGTQATAIYYSDLMNNGNDTSFTINGLVIPVELESFTATPRQDGAVVLSWNTQSETSNMGFEVERGDGEIFEKIGFVEGRGTTSLKTEYTFIDQEPRKNARGHLVFYRLKQIDADGSSAYSHIVSAALPPPTVGLEQIYPNPVDIGAPVLIPYTLAVPASVTLEIVDALGRRVALLSDGLTRDAGRYEATWDGRDASGPAPAGMYFARFRADIGNGESIHAVRRIVLVR